ncbi:MAG: hypothetical protein U9Q06_03240 [Nanoarchaeota archaeon]|nr:hypothetical protein [Nanoarchaeota archaeon]
MRKIISLILALIFLVSFVAGGFDFSEGISDSDETEFNTAGGAPQCEITGLSAKWIIQGEDAIQIILNGVVPASVTAQNGCYKTYGVPHPVCCPQGYECDRTDGKCKIETPLAMSCEDYNESQSVCEGANIENVADSIYGIFLENLDVGGYDLGYGIDDLEFCGGDPLLVEELETVYANCGCVWADGECSAYYDSMLLGPPEEYDVGCIVNLNVLENRCEDDGVYVISWNSSVIQFENGAPVLSGGSPVLASSDRTIVGCVDGFRDFQCPTTSFVPFFTLMNLLVTVLGISFVYFVFSKK